MLEANAARLAEIEHARTALELRCRRYAAQNERLTNVLDGLAEAVIAVDPFDGLWLANRSAEQLLQLGGDALAKRELAQLAHCEKLVGLLADAGRRKVRTTRTDELELDVCGGRRWHSVTTTSLPGGPAHEPVKGEIQAGVVAVLRDISTQKAQQRDHAEFVSAASHEMKTPLAGIKAYVELLAEGDAEDEETRDEFLQIINGQADRLQRLIDNLLNLARIEAGVVQVSKQSQSLNEILLEAFRVVQPAAEAKNIQLSDDLSPMYLGALVDRDMMLQAAINLLSNAIKYTPGGGRVTLRSRMLDGEVLFEVEDTGVGLGPEDCLRVFEKFYRVDCNKGMAPGTGLGLPLAKHIVEDVHGGRLGVTSTLGAGSTFRVTIPGSHRSS
jgi:two-component system phosphate regulon sensor histidine kinase PhoR